jgi:hypothetical protein
MTRTTAKDQRISLGLEDTVALRQGGEDGGNAWIKENQDSNISFANVDLGPHRNPPGNYPDVWTFMRFHFPNGRKDFTNTNFGEG